MKKNPCERKKCENECLSIIKYIQLKVNEKFAGHPGVSINWIKRWIYKNFKDLLLKCNYCIEYIKNCGNDVEPIINPTNNCSIPTICDIIDAAHSNLFIDDLPKNKYYEFKSTFSNIPNFLGTDISSIAALGYIFFIPTSLYATEFPSFPRIITIFSYIPKGSKNIFIISTSSASSTETLITYPYMEDYFQIFTKDGYHLVGTPLNFHEWVEYTKTELSIKSYVETNIFKKYNCFKDTTYKLPEEESDTPGYDTLHGELNTGILDIANFKLSSGKTVTYYRNPLNQMNIRYSGLISYIYSLNPFDPNTIISNYYGSTSYFIDNAIEDLIIVGFFCAGGFLYGTYESCGESEEENNVHSMINNSLFITNTILKDTASSETYVLPLNNQDLEKTKDNINTLHLKLNIDFLGEPDELVEDLNDNPDNPDNPDDPDDLDIDLPKTAKICNTLLDFCTMNYYLQSKDISTLNNILNKINNSFDFKSYYDVADFIRPDIKKINPNILTDILYVTTLNDPNYSSGIDVLTFIPAGLKNVEIYSYGVDYYPNYKTGDDSIQLFTKDGYHLVGTPINSYFWKYIIGVMFYNSLIIDEDIINALNVKKYLKENLFKSEYCFENNIDYKLPGDDPDLPEYSKMIGKLNIGQTDIEKYHPNSLITHTYYRESNPNNKMKIGFSGSWDYIQWSNNISNMMPYMDKIYPLRHIFIKNVIEDLIVVIVHSAGGFITGFCEEPDSIVNEPEIEYNCNLINIKYTSTKKCMPYRLYINHKIK